MIRNTVRFLLLALLFSDCTNVIEFIPRHKFPHLSKKYSSEGFTKQELEANLKTDVEGYFLDFVSDVKPTEIARVGSDKKSIVFKKLGKFTATVAFVNANGRGFKFLNASFKILRGTAETLTFTKISKAFVSGGKFTTADILGGVQGTKTGYTIKNITALNPSNLATVTASKELKISGRLGSFTATIILQHPAKADVIIRNCAFEIIKLPAPSLTFQKVTEEFTSGAIISTAEILAGVQGSKTGYTLKSINNLDPNNIVNLIGSAPYFSLNVLKLGNFTATIVLQHPTKANVHLTNCQFEITKRNAENLTFTKISKAFSSGGKFSTADILGGVRGNKTGYTVKNITVSSNIVTVSSTKTLDFKNVAGAFTATIILQHSTKADVIIRNCQFEITKRNAENLTFTKISKAFVSGGKFSVADILGGVRGTKTGYTVKNITNLNPSNLATVTASKELIFSGRAGTFTATIILQHSTKPDVTIRNCQFEITKRNAENLTFTKISKAFSSGGKFSVADILGGVQGTKTGYTIKNIAELNPSNLATVTASKELIFSGRAGAFTATIILQHSTKADVTITNCQFEITKRNAENLTFTKISKAFSSGGKFSVADILGGVRGTKTGYTVKNITNLNPSNLATVTASKELIFSGRAGAFTATIILEHPTKQDVSIPSCQFEITKANAETLIFTKIRKAFSSGGKFTTADILWGVRGNKTGYTVKNITALNPASLATVSSSKELNFSGSFG